jgi:hypothetical protein
MHYLKEKIGILLSSINWGEEGWMRVQSYNKSGPYSCHNILL